MAFIRRSRFVVTAAIVMGLSLVASAPAEAKIYIPCTGDRLVTVAEVPKEKQDNGRIIHLGYRFPGCIGDGEWIGTTDQSDKFYKLNEGQLKELVQRAGLKQLPPTPSRWQYPFQALLVEILTVGALVLVFGWDFIKKRRSPPSAA